MSNETASWIAFITITAAIYLGPKVYRIIRNRKLSQHSEQGAHQGPLLGVVYPETKTKTKDKK